MDSAERFIRRTRLFESYSKWAWPLHRLLVKKHLSKRCVKCQGSEKLSPLSPNGLCAVCQSPSEKSKSELSPAELKNMRSEFDKLMRESCGKGKSKYDALVMSSGGKDSAYLLHRLKTEYPNLRILAITFNNGFFSPVAKKNAHHMAKQVGVDQIDYRVAPNFYKKLFRYACAHSSKTEGTFNTVDLYDGYYATQTAKNMAAEMGIPLVMLGFTLSQIDLIFSVRDFILSDEIFSINLIDRIDKGLLNTYDAHEKKCWLSPGQLPEGPLPKMVFPLVVWDESETFIREEVLRLNLIEKGNESPLVTNPPVLLLMVIADYLALGYASYEPEFARNIREGKADGRYWRNVFEMTEFSARTGWFIRKEALGLLKDLGLTPKDINLEHWFR